jgi:hypothetical protein
MAAQTLSPAQQYAPNFGTIPKLDQRANPALSVAALQSKASFLNSGTPAQHSYYDALGHTVANPFFNVPAPRYSVPTNPGTGLPYQTVGSSGALPQPGTMAAVLPGSSKSSNQAKIFGS